MGGKQQNLGNVKKKSYFYTIAMMISSNLFLLPRADMENVPSKPSAARVIFFGSSKFWVLTYAFFCREWRKYYLVCRHAKCHFLYTIQILGPNILPQKERNLWQNQIRNKAGKPK